MRHLSQRGTLHIRDNLRLTSSLHYIMSLRKQFFLNDHDQHKCCHRNGSVYWSPNRKNHTNICIFLCLKSLLRIFFLNRKQKTICYPKGGRTKMEMKGHCDILLFNSLPIYNHQEQGTWHYSLFKNTQENYKVISQSSPKNHTVYFPYKLHTCFQTALQQEKQYFKSFAILHCIPLRLRGQKQLPLEKHLFTKTTTSSPTWNSNPSHSRSERNFVTICSISLVRPLTIDHLGLDFTNTQKGVQGPRLLQDDLRRKPDIMPVGNRVPAGCIPFLRRSKAVLQSTLRKLTGNKKREQRVA